MVLKAQINGEYTLHLILLYRFHILLTMSLLRITFVLHHLQVPQTPLRPYSFQANLDVWSVYLYNHLSQFPPYDIELICENDLTMVDLHRQFLNPGQQSLPLAVVHADPFDPATREVSVLMKQFTSMLALLNVCCIFVSCA